MKEFKLNKEPKATTGFTTPEGYFDVLSEKIMQEIDNSEKPKIIVLNKVNWKIAVAAVLVLGLFVSVFNTFNKQSDTIEAPIIENYLVNSTNINQYDLISEIELNEIENIEINLDFGDKNLEEILNSNIKIETIINE
jgi:hypothetical protein